ncbi:uncharacterized protein (DUF1810 family) [Dongia mobilis]|uniref:Uncharacterized protein (DUF1810 family) n=1 Tax=Dongia mobilis TaxID=578943 RepID=A0A4R6WSY7_9PROT|nr:DUF1810 domain-containing protein [Dongia mobilis]TDQ83128.1 uncharacterized protein (DUF1810 family) [Dongia mobilis]
MSADPFDLERFVAAQDPLHETVLAELRAGRKESHWMWFVFPQIAGLGLSSMSRRYAIASRAEAAAYLAHPVLGPRLRQCTALVNAHGGADIHAILGSPDDMKFHAAMTLFEDAAGTVADRAPFQTALRLFFGGSRHAATLNKLRA